MPDHNVLVTVSAGADQTSAPGIMHHFTPGQRLLRVLGTMGIFVVAAAALIPIPIIHLVGIPLLLLIGIVASGRQALSVARLEPVRIPCPRCEGSNRIGGGFGYRSMSDPLEITCESCRRGLTVTFRERE